MEMVPEEKFAAETAVPVEMEQVLKVARTVLC